MYIPSDCADQAGCLLSGKVWLSAVGLRISWRIRYDFRLPACFHYWVIIAVSTSNGNCSKSPYLQVKLRQIWRSVRQRCHSSTLPLHTVPKFHHASRLARKTSWRYDCLVWMAGNIVRHRDCFLLASSDRRHRQDKTYLASSWRFCDSAAVCTNIMIYA